MFKCLVTTVKWPLAVWDTNLQICRILKFDYYLIAITSRTTSWRWVDIFEDIISWNIIWGYFPQNWVNNHPSHRQLHNTETFRILVQIYSLAEILFLPTQENLETGTRYKASYLWWIVKERMKAFKIENCIYYLVLYKVAKLDFLAVKG